MLVTRRGEEGSGVLSSASTSRKDSRPLSSRPCGRAAGSAARVSSARSTSQWTFIDEVARATEDSGRDHDRDGRARRETELCELCDSAFNPATDRGLDARTIILQRRSAVALDGVSSTDRATFLRMLSRVLPGPGAPWDALWWSPRIHLALFVHRVDGRRPRSVPAGPRGLGGAAAQGRIPPRVRLGTRGRRLSAVAAAGGRLPVALAASQLRSGDRGRRILQPRDDRRLRRRPRRCTALPSIRHLFWESGRGRSGAVSRSGSGRRPRHRNRLFLRRPGASNCSAFPATRFRACTTSPSGCRSRTRGSRRNPGIRGRRQGELQIADQMLIDVGMICNPLGDLQS